MFPMVAIFHVLWLGYLIWDDRHEPFPDVAWLQAAWMIGYTVFWIAACDLRKWGALGYILVTLIDTGVYFGAWNHKISAEYVSNIFLIDGLFSFFLLFYYKRFSQPPVDQQ